MKNFISKIGVCIIVSCVLHGSVFAQGGGLQVANVSSISVPAVYQPVTNCMQVALPYGSDNQIALPQCFEIDRTADDFFSEANFEEIEVEQVQLVNTKKFFKGTQCWENFQKAKERYIKQKHRKQCIIPKKYRQQIGKHCWREPLLQKKQKIKDGMKCKKAGLFSWFSFGCRHVSKTLEDVGFHPSLDKLAQRVTGEGPSEAAILLLDKMINFDAENCLEICAQKGIMAAFCCQECIELITQEVVKQELGNLSHQSSCSSDGCDGEMIIDLVEFVEKSDREDEELCRKELWGREDYFGERYGFIYVKSIPPYDVVKKCLKWANKYELKAFFKSLERLPIDFQKLVVKTAIAWVDDPIEIFSNDMFGTLILYVKNLSKDLKKDVFYECVRRDMLADFLLEIYHLPNDCDYLKKVATDKYIKRWPGDWLLIDRMKDLLEKQQDIVVDKNVATIKNEDKEIEFEAKDTKKTEEEREKKIGRIKSNNVDMLHGLINQVKYLSYKSKKSLVELGLLKGEEVQLRWRWWDFPKDLQERIAAKFGSFDQFCFLHREIVDTVILVGVLAAIVAAIVLCWRCCCVTPAGGGGVLPVGPVGGLLSPPEAPVGYPEDFTGGGDL